MRLSFHRLSAGLLCLNGLGRALGRGLLLGLCGWAFGVVPAAIAQETPHAQVQRLLNAGQAQEALQGATAHLAQHPRDVQMRLLKGVLLNQLGQSDAALTEFTALTREHPELPEPFNNLAVLHAQAGRLDLARDALEAALRLHRDYATAHRNLADVYLRLALQSYQETQRLAPNDPGLAAHLQALQALTATGAPPR